MQLAELHVFRKLGRLVLLNVETLRYYSIDPWIADLIRDLATDPAPLTAEALSERYGQSRLRFALRDLVREGIVRDTSLGDNSSPAALPIRKRRGIRNLELMITHGCNLRCSYCYGVTPAGELACSPHLFGAAQAAMPIEVAQAGIDFLYRQCGESQEACVTFFGGEPLLAFDQIQSLVPYILAEASRRKISVKLDLSTNATLLTPPIARFLADNSFICQISIDGTSDAHNAHRRFPAGYGSYQATHDGARLLLEVMPGRVRARLTVTTATDLIRDTTHLLEMGFQSVQAEPAVGGTGPASLDDAGVKRMIAAENTLAETIITEHLAGRALNYHTIKRRMIETRSIRVRKGFHCGAARTLVALSQDGGFYPCHRFVGIPAFRMGSLTDGFDPAWQERILELSVDLRSGCRECWARYLCGGGCWKHAYDAHGTVERPDTDGSCEIIRNQIECALAMNTILCSTAGPDKGVGTRPDPVV